jgi:hypothetical protein
MCNSCEAHYCDMIHLQMADPYTTLSTSHLANLQDCSVLVKGLYVMQRCINYGYQNYDGELYQKYWHPHRAPNQP